jgi:hypothetical protein
MEPPRTTNQAGHEHSDSPVEPSVDDLGEEVQTVLELLARIHEQTLALVELLSEINKRSYRPAAEFWRELQSPGGSEPSKE